jgi:tetratricopeptide (TPR) repeat protein
VLRYMLYFDTGEYDAARQASQKNVQYQVEQNPRRKIGITKIGDFNQGLCYVKEGRIDSAREKLEEIESALTDVSGWEKENMIENVNFLQAEIWLAEGSIEDALTYAEKIDHPLGFQPFQPFSFYRLSVCWPEYRDQRARLYTKKGDLDLAIAEYEGLVSPDPTKTNNMIHPRYYYSLGKLYEQKSMKDKARRHYRRFLELWKDADPGIAEVEDAKARLAAL